MSYIKEQVTEVVEALGEDLSQAKHAYMANKTNELSRKLRRIRSLIWDAEDAVEKCFKDSSFESFKPFELLFPLAGEKLAKFILWQQVRQAMLIVADQPIVSCSHSM